MANKFSTGGGRLNVARALFALARALQPSPACERRPPAASKQPAL